MCCLFTAMVAVESANVGVNILFKAATSKGMSYYIFITYSYAIAALLLLPLSSILYRETEEMTRRYCYKDVLPFTAMVAVESANVGVNILFKAATSKGMSYFIFIAYSHAIAALLLLPLSVIFYSRAVLPPLKFHLVSRICLLGLIGFTGQVFSYKGIEYSSPTLASAVGNLSPAFTFILAVLFRMEKIALRSSTAQAKIMGTIVSISGALIVILYKGPQLFSSSRWRPSSALIQWPPKSSSPESSWVMGGVLITVAYLLFSFWNIVQTQVMEMYPQELTVAFFCNLCETFIAIPVSLIAEPNLSSWRLTPSIAVVTVLYSGVFSSINSFVRIWGVHLKGPVYVAIFKPLSVAIAAFMSAIFLGEILHLGSVIGAIILCIGFYAVIWGKAKEEERIDDDSGLGCSGHSANDKAPLLQSHKAEDI